MSVALHLDRMSHIDHVITWFPNMAREVEAGSLGSSKLQSILDVDSLNSHSTQFSRLQFPGEQILRPWLKLSCCLTSMVFSYLWSEECF